MRVIGKKIYSTVKELKNGLTIPNMMECITWEKNKEREFMSGLINPDMKGNGTIIKYKICNKKQISGKGKYVWSDDRTYEGEWLNNNMHGRGVYKWTDGRRYEGEYYNDKKHV